MRGKFVKVFLSAGFIVLVLLAITAIYAQHQLSVQVSKDTVFTIAPGNNLNGIVGRLTEDGLLPVNTTVFKAIALLGRDEGAIQAGQYQLTSGMNSLDLLDLFRSGQVIRYRITFPEGWRLEQWLAKLREAAYLESETIGMSKDELRQSLDLESGIEGWLFPDTYQYIQGDTDLDILRLAVRTMKDVLAREWDSRAASTLTTPYEALVLASMIEKESGYAPDREKIASVFHNRLDQGMRLQSDPTVIFGIGPSFDGDLKRSHLRTDTPYNTYTRTGLPPGPICSPGRASINAALGGSSHPYLYFVAKGDGKSYFSTNLAEHNQAVNQYQRNQQ